jgi:hypothetical protein
MDEILKEMEIELASLKKELIDICNDIKVCQTKEEREELFEDKKLTQLDIEEVSNEIARYKELLSEKESVNADETASENEVADETPSENEDTQDDEIEDVSDEKEEENTPQDISENDETETIETEEV